MPFRFRDRGRISRESPDIDNGRLGAEGSRGCRRKEASHFRGRSFHRQLPFSEAAQSMLVIAGGDTARRICWPTMDGEW